MIAQTAHDQIGRIRVGRAGALRRFSLDKFEVQRVRQSRDHLILQLEQIGGVYSKRSAQRCAPDSRIDELRIDPHPVLVALDRAFEHIANAELLADLLGVEGFCPCR